MIRISLIASLLCMNICFAASQTQEFGNYIIFGTGDYNPVFGPGADPAFDSPEGIAGIMKYFKGRGFTAVIHRPDITAFSPESVYRNPIGNDVPEHQFLMKVMEDTINTFPQTRVIRESAEAQGLEYWAWYPNVYSDGCPSDIPRDGLDKTNWVYENKYVREHREVLVVDRKGKKQYGVMEYAYPGARRAKVAEFEYLAKKYGIRNFIACLRSEASQMQPPPTDGDQFGFNKPIVDEMKRIYGVDILTDPRFDFKDSNFNRADPMLENWRKLRGSYLTQFYRELRQAMDAIDPGIKIAVQLPGGDYIGPPHGNMCVDWRTWINEGLINMIVYGITLEASLDSQAPSKGYLTDAIAEKGQLPVSVFRDFIDKSKHPQTKLIQPNGNYYFFRAPDKGFDGWRTDAFCTSFNVAWNQHWQQWMRDIKDFGYIKFFEQNFDLCPIYNEAYYGGYGDPRYEPKIRACTGIWTWLGDGTDVKPVSQNQIKKGDKGNAMKLTCGPDAKRVLRARHWSGRDRRMYTFTTNNILSDGKCIFEFSILCQGTNSGVSVYMQNNRMLRNHDVGLQVTAADKICYSKNGKMVDTGISAKHDQWQDFVIEVDLIKKNYSAYLGRDKNVPLFSNVAYSLEDNAFDVLMFIPSDKTGGSVYVDDVLVKWFPELYEVAGDPVIAFVDDCESYVSRSYLGKDLQSKWRVESADDDKRFMVENNMAYGESIKCIRANGGGMLVSSRIPVQKGATLTLDFDVFIKSALAHIAMVPPAEGLKSENGTIVELVNDSNEVLASIMTDSSGVWNIWDASGYVASGAATQYDVWNRIKMIFDVKANTYSLVIQPIGELPRKIATVKCGQGIKSADGVYFRIKPSHNAGHISCYDNLIVRNYLCGN